MTFNFFPRNSLIKLVICYNGPKQCVSKLCYRIREEFLIQEKKNSQ